jgi:ABC-2 type transport system permease protein
LPATGVVITHSLLPMFGLAVLYMIVSMSMGVFMSIALANLVTSSQMLLLVNAPSFVFSGYTYPRWAMPHIVAYIAKAIPVTNFLDGFFPMYLYDTPTMRGVVPLLISCGVLWFLTAIALSNIGKKFRTLFNKHQIK